MRLRDFIKTTNEIMCVRCGTALYHVGKTIVENEATLRGWGVIDQKPFCPECVAIHELRKTKELV